jgi:hypothetical protein
MFTTSIKETTPALSRQSNVERKPRYQGSLTPSTRCLSRSQILAQVHTQLHDGKGCTGTAHTAFGNRLESKGRDSAGRPSGRSGGRAEGICKSLC